MNRFTVCQNNESGYWAVFDYTYTRVLDDTLFKAKADAEAAAAGHNEAHRADWSYMTDPEDEEDVDEQV